jgi:hypothetical protein
MTIFLTGHTGFHLTLDLLVPDALFLLLNPFQARGGVPNTGFSLSWGVPCLGPGPQPRPGRSGASRLARRAETSPPAGWPQ